MGSSVLLDNWLLQDVSTLLREGPSDTTSNTLVVNRESDSHTTPEVPRAAIQIDALIALLVDVVLRDNLVLDEKYADTWARDPSQVRWLEHQGVLDLRPIDVYSPVANHAKKKALAELCATSTLMRIQRENETSFSQRRESEHPFYSVVIWGTAGNLGRSAEIRLPYSPHPIRRDIIGQTVFRSSSAMGRVHHWIRTERAKVYARVAPGGEVRGAQLLLPPVVVQILEEANVIEDLIPVALQLREHYEPLRGWVREFQQAMDDEDAKALMKRQRVLESVSRHLAGQAGCPKYGSTSVSISTGWFGFSLPLPGPGDVLQRFGVRGTLNKLVMTRAGGKALDKLLRLLELENTTLGLETKTHLEKVHAPPQGGSGG